MVDKTAERILLEKYQRYAKKLNECKAQDNRPMYEIYKNKTKTIRMTLGILGITIKGINS